MRKTLSNLRFTIAVIALSLLVLTLVLLLAGIRPFILKSGSMQPLYRKGSLVFVNTRVRPEDAAIGDVIVYRTDSGALVMHRLVGINEVKGDANPTAENVVLTRVNFIGRASRFSIAGLGTVVEYIQSVPWAVGAAVLLFIVLSCIPWREPDNTRPQCRMHPRSQRKVLPCRRADPAASMHPRSQRKILPCGRADPAASMHPTFAEKNERPDAKEKVRKS